MKSATGEGRSPAPWKSSIVACVALLGALVAMVCLAGLALAGTSGEQSPPNLASVPGKATKAPYPSNAPWCGPAWVTETAAEQYGALHGLVAVSENDIWVVGGTGASTHTERWDGTVWTTVSSPNVGTYSNGFFGIAAIAANDIWAVGAHSTTTTDYQTLTEHWDGTQWSVVPSPNVSTYNHSLLGVAAVATNDVWAVGNYLGNPNGPNQTLIEHWNGTNWSIVNSPNVGTGGNTLAGVAAVSASDIWAVGNYHSNSVDYTLIERWNGTTWTVVTSPNIGAGSVLTAVSVVAANDIWAVGYSGNNYNATLVEHWDGIGWSVIPSPNVGTAQNVLYGVAASATNDIWAGGVYYNGSAPARTLVEHWNGSSWSVVSSPSPGDSDNELFGVAVASANDVWAAGFYNNSAGPLAPLIEHYNPCTGTPTPGPSPTPGGSPTACAIQFSDVPQGSTFYSFIHCLACLGLINGYPDGTFKPNANVTRGQLSKIVSNAAGFSDNQTTQIFQDVPAGSTFFQFIGGYPCGGLGEPCVPPANLPYFRSNSQATRGQISKIVSNAAGFNDTPTGQQFQDVLPGTTYYTYTYRLVTRNVMGGYPCGTAPAGPCLPPDNWPYFVPNNNATRGQTSKIVSNTFFPNCSPPEH
jgi:hypothetical protein